MSSTRQIDVQQTIAYHEAGHVVIARALGRPVAAVTIVASVHAFGTMWAKLPEPDAACTTAEEDIQNIADVCSRARALMPIGESRLPAANFITGALDRGIELLAGPEAERRLNGSFDASTAQSDLAQARLYAAAIAVTPEMAHQYMDLFHAEARALVNRYWHSVTAVAEALIERQTLTGDEVDSIISEAEAARIAADEKSRRAAWRETVARVEQFERSGVRL
jgi:hypothetical protein